jgi:2-iminobutanoate/2-iminopropanoate deaminase
MISYVSPRDTFALPGMSAGVIVNGPCLFVSGQVALDDAGAAVGKGDFPRQVAQVMSNLDAVLREGQASLRDVIKVGVFLSDRKYLATWRELRGNYFSHPFPESTLIIAELISPDFLIEIEAIAVVRRTGVGAPSPLAGEGGSMAQRDEGVRGDPREN